MTIWKPISKDIPSTDEIMVLKDGFAYRATVAESHLKNGTLFYLYCSLTGRIISRKTRADKWCETEVFHSAFDKL